MSVIDQIADGSGGFLLFALTPPRLQTAGDRAQEIADATLARLRPLDLDAVVLYDIADEVSRNPAERPFPFMPTLDPAVNAAKNLVSDYHHTCAALGAPAAPIIFTFSVCGSMRTLEFLRWLGVDVPRWIENGLRNATDTLEASYRFALAAATDLITYCRDLGAPFGINVESVSIRRVEIEMAIRLAQELGTKLRD